MSWLSLSAIIALGILGWMLYRHFRGDDLQAFNDKHRSTSRVVSRGEFVDGNRHMDVALALSDSTFFYENSDMQASLDVEWIREVEYDSTLATGRTVEGGRVLRLRSASQTFEFVIPDDMVGRWYTVMPPRGVVSMPAIAVATPSVSGAR